VRIDREVIPERKLGTYVVVDIAFRLAIVFTADGYPSVFWAPES